MGKLISLRLFAVASTAALLLTLSPSSAVPAAADQSRVPSQLELSRFLTGTAPGANFFESEPAPEVRKSRFKVRKMTILNYKQPLRVGSNDMLLRFRAPGTKKSIVTMELLF